jgi:hypothetical protein
MTPDDRVKTGCAGIIIPLAAVAYATIWFFSPESVSTWGIRPIRGRAAMGHGITILGIALFVHALGFVPYRRYRILQIAVILIAIATFFTGLFWSDEPEH